MCQKTIHEVPLQLLVRSMCQFIVQIKENTSHCRSFLSENDDVLSAAFRDAEHTAAELQSKLEQIISDLDSGEDKARSRHTKITYLD